MNTTIKPTSDRILIELAAKPEKSSAGIYYPASHHSRTEGSEGFVLATGPGKRNSNGVIVKPEVNVGDRVVFNPYGGQEIKIEDKEYRLCSPSDVLAIVPTVTLSL